VRSKRPHKKRRPRFGLIFLLVFLVLCGIAYLLSLPIWQIREVVVNGVSMLSEKDVRTMAGVPISENLFYASLKRARSNLKKITAIKEVRFYRIPPATILINITERKPVAAIVFTGKSAVIDADGYIINRNGNVELNIPNMVDLPVITGLREKDVMKAEKVGENITRVVEDILIKLSPFLESKRLQLDMGNPDAILLQTASYEPGACYPDGANMEIFWNGASRHQTTPANWPTTAWNGDYVELETISPLRHLLPGEKLGYGVSWKILARPKGATDMELVDYCRQHAVASPVLSPE